MDDDLKREVPEMDDSSYLSPSFLSNRLRMATFSCGDRPADSSLNISMTRSTSPSDRSNRIDQRLCSLRLHQESPVSQLPAQ